MHVAPTGTTRIAYRILTRQTEEWVGGDAVG